MTLSLYEITIPVFIANIKILQNLINKGVTYASSSENSSSEQALLDSKLISDMGDLIFQVTRVSNTAKDFCVRLGAIPEHVFPNDEKTFADLQSRLAKTIEILEGVKVEDIKEDAEVSWGPQTFTGKVYNLNFAIPNFFFHFVTAYGLLRKEGVPIGKANYVGVAN